MISQIRINPLPDRPEHLPERPQEGAALDLFTIRHGHDQEQVDENQQPRDHEPGHPVESLEGDKPGDEERPYGEGKGPAHVEDGIGKSRPRACIGEHHARHGGVEHGRSDGAEGNAEQEQHVGWCDPCEGHKDDRQDDAAENEKTGLIAVRKKPHIGLDDKREKAAQAADESDLGQGEGEPIREDGQQRCHEGVVEIPGKVDEREREENPDVGFFRRLGHGRSFREKRSDDLKRSCRACQGMALNQALGTLLRFAQLLGGLRHQHRILQRSQLAPAIPGNFPGR